MNDFIEYMKYSQLHCLLYKFIKTYIKGLLINWQSYFFLIPSKFKFPKFELL